MASFLPMPDPYEDALSGLSDEDRKRFLEQYAPGPVHTGAVTQGVQGFAPTPMPRGALMPDRPGLVHAPAASAASPAVDDDLMRRFAEAQQQGARNAAFANLGGNLDNFARVYAGLPERQVDTDGVRGRPAAELMQAEGVKTQQRMQARQAELDKVNLAKTRAETSKAEASAVATEADAKREAALADPKSPESAALRATAISLLKDSNGESMIPREKLEAMSGVQIRDALKYGTSQINAEAMAGYRRTQLDMTAEQQAFQRQMEKWRAGLEIERLKQDWTKFGLSQEQQLELAKLRAKYDAEKDARERGEKLEEREVGGFQFSEGRTPSLQNAKTMTEVAVQSRKIKNSLGKLRSLYSQYGTELFGTHAGEMESEFKSITDALRIMNEMGVPNGKDYEMLAMELANPTTWSDLFTSKGRGLEKMDVLERRVDDNVGITADVLGYKPAGGMSRPAPRVGTRDNPAPPNSTYADPKKPDVDLSEDEVPTTHRKGGSTPKPASGTAREVDIRGMKPGDLKKYLVREKVPDGPVRLSNGKMFNWAGGKLLPVTE